MGRRQDRNLSENHEIAKAYLLYTSCRRRSLVVASLPKGNKGDTSTKIVPYTDGLLFLPEPGGMLDQPYRLMSFFEAFESGEQEAFNMRMKQ